MSADGPIAYIPRIRRYYERLGYGAPYAWAQFQDVPFARLQKPLKDCRVAIVTTAAPFQPDKGDQGPGAPYNAAAKFYKVYAVDSGSEPDLRISHVSIDRKHTTAEDINSYLPLAALHRAADHGRIGAVSARVFGLPTNRSQRTTLDVDCTDLLDLVKADAADAVILVPNCPVCHQSVSLAARVLEDTGIATVIIGCAKDIVEHVGVPRFVFSDFPLGNAAGKPGDKASQDMTLKLALDLLEQARGPRSTVTSPMEWSSDHGWKQDYSNIERLSADEIARRRVDFDRGKTIALELRRGTGTAAT